MSWQYTRYEARCDVCGNTGVCTQGSDDWGRSSTTWEGFSSKQPDPTAVARKRKSADPTSVCPSCHFLHATLPISDIVPLVQSFPL